jgi:pimeloyl-ACP methyl ester carboxylesterase
LLDQPISAGADRLIIADIEIERLRFDGGGRPVLFLHPKDGPAGDAVFLKALATAGHDVHAPWLPGFGHSNRPDGFIAVRDLACFAAAYLAEQDLQNALIVGASFGGWVAAEMATRDVSHMAGLVLIDAFGLKFGHRNARDIADFHSEPAEDIAAKSWFNPAAHGSDANTLTQAEAIGEARSGEAFALYGWRPYMHDPGLGRWLARLDLPTTVLWGEADGIVSPDYGRAYAALMPGAGFEIIAGAAHYPTREQATETAKRVAAFKL